VREAIEKDRERKAIERGNRKREIDRERERNRERKRDGE
jgi:hypothetical protein